MKDRLTEWRTTGLGIAGAAAVAWCGATGGHFTDPNTWVPAAVVALVGMYLKPPKK